MMQSDDLWVFAYGSLMWDPGFPFAERRRARLDGFARRFALWSWHYRGTAERPGLVLGLDWAPGAQCLGIAYRIASEADRETRHYLQRRELISYAYFETIQPIVLTAEAERPQAEVPALCYILDRSHTQYAGALAAEDQARHIAGASGLSGPNADYLRNTCAHLAELGLDDPALAALDRRVGALLTDGAPA